MDFEQYEEWLDEEVGFDYLYNEDNNIIDIRDICK